jgi:hypothetical protein
MWKPMCRCSCNSDSYESVLLQHHCQWNFSLVLKIVQLPKLGCVHLHMSFHMPAHPSTSVCHHQFLRHGWKVLVLMLLPHSDESEFMP